MTTPLYTVLIRRAAERDMDRLPREEFDRVSDAILLLESKPRPVGCKRLRGRDQCRIRVGNYRVLYTIDDTAKLVQIEAVGHRKDVYREH